MTGGGGDGGGRRRRDGGKERDEADRDRERRMRRRWRWRRRRGGGRGCNGMDGSYGSEECMELDEKGASVKVISLLSDMLELHRMLWL